MGDRANDQRQTMIKNLYQKLIYQQLSVVKIYIHIKILLIMPDSFDVYKTGNSPKAFR